MSFTRDVKDEISKDLLNEIENRYLLLGYIFVNGIFSDNKLSIHLENMAVARKLFKTFKYSYKSEVKMTLRVQKKFKVKQIFIFEVDNSKHIFDDEIKNIDFSDSESLYSFVKGIFLASGSINDPKSGSYHLELVFDDYDKARWALDLLSECSFKFKYLKRTSMHMLYLKSGEEISDFLKLLGATNSVFYFEDIRIYRDHKNMVNRLNNCEQANLEKSLNTSQSQIDIINYLKDQSYFSLLDEKTQQVANYRVMYSEASFRELADIIGREIDKKISKSYINHHFRKINELYDRVQKE